MDGQNSEVVVFTYNDGMKNSGWALWGGGVCVGKSGDEGCCEEG